MEQEPPPGDALTRFHPVRTVVLEAPPHLLLREPGLAVGFQNSECVVGLDRMPRACDFGKILCTNGCYCRHQQSVWRVSKFRAA